MRLMQRLKVHKKPSNNPASSPRTWPVKDGKKVKANQVTPARKPITRGRGAPRTIQEANNVYAKRLTELWEIAKQAGMPKTYWESTRRRAKTRINQAIDLRKMHGKVSAKFVIDIILGEIQAINDSVFAFKKRRQTKK